MPKKLFPLPKLKNKSGRFGYVISEPDGKLMTLSAIRIMRGEGNNRVLVELEYPDEKVEDQVT